MYILFTWKLFYIISVESGKWGCNTYLHISRAKGRNERAVKNFRSRWFPLVTKFEKFRKEGYSSRKQEKRRKFENHAIYLNKIKD